MSDTGVVERYLDAMVRHDWEAMAGCLTDDVVRVGPFGDIYAGRGEYVAFIRDLLPALPGYHMQVDRVLYFGDPPTVAVAELTETIDVAGSPLRTPEALVFDLARTPEPEEFHRLHHVAIQHIAIYIVRLGEQPRIPTTGATPESPERESSR